MATGVPDNPHMALHAMDEQPPDRGHVVLYQRGGLPWLRKHLMALRSWASTFNGADIRLHNHPSTGLDRAMALSVDQTVPTHPDVLWHPASLNAGWLNPPGYYWVPESWGHTSSDA